jgi:hypothetical protein
MPWLRAMLRGTIASIKARREAAPMTDNMCCSSSGPKPMWRATNSEGFSNSPKGLSEDINIMNS